MTGDAQKHLVLVYRIRGDQTRYWVGRCRCGIDVHDRDREVVEAALAECREKATNRNNRNEIDE